MGNFFNVDNKFFTFMGKLCDMIFVSIIWGICAALTIFDFMLIKQIGIVFLVIAIPAAALIGPAMTALYYTVIKSVRRDRGYVTKEFFHSFKQNFKISAIMAYILFIVIFVLYVDFSYSAIVLKGGGLKENLLIALFVLVSVLTAFMCIWSFPILSRFTLSVKQLIKTTFLISIRHFPSSIAAVFIAAIALLGMYVMPVLIVIVPALFCFICSFLFERVFKKYMPKPEGTPEETGKDQWYWE